MFTHCPEPTCLLTFDAGNPPNLVYPARSPCPCCQKLLQPGILPPSLVSLSGYQFGGVLGNGGFGVVYHGLDQSLHTAVVAKMIFGNEIVRFGANFVVAQAQINALLGAQVRHPNLVRALGLYRVGQGAALVADKVNGISLEGWFQGVTPPAWFGLGPLPPASSKRTLLVLQTLLAALSGLCALHQHQPPIWHLDFKPANVLATPNLDESKLIDLDSAVASGTGWPRPPTMSLGYTPIEQILADSSWIGERSDLHAFGYSLVEGLVSMIDDQLYEQLVRSLRMFILFQGQTSVAAGELYDLLRWLLGLSGPPAAPQPHAIDVCRALIAIYQWAEQGLQRAGLDRSLVDLILALIHPLPEARTLTSSQVNDRLTAIYTQLRAQERLGALATRLGASSAAPAAGPSWQRALRLAQSLQHEDLRDELDAIEQAGLIDPPKALEVFEALRGLGRYKLEDIAIKLRPLMAPDPSCLGKMLFELAKEAYYEQEPLAARFRAQEALQLGESNAQLVLYLAQHDIDAAWAAVGGQPGDLPRLQDALDAYGELPGLRLKKLGANALAGALGALGVARKLLQVGAFPASLSTWLAVTMPHSSKEDMVLFGSHPVRLIALGCSAILGRAALVTSLLGTFTFAGRLQAIKVLSP